MNRPHLENRSPAQAQSRAVVIDAAVAKTIVWLAGGALASCIGLGLWIGITVQGFEGRVGALEKGQPVRDAQIIALQAANAEQDRRGDTNDNEQNRRITALEITITGLGALRERMDQGFAEIAKRLDRMEDAP